jgi:predicted ribosomally synthesized peptide with nif11-like leader
MSTTDAVGFLERVESDEPFARKLEALKDNPNALFEEVKAAGFDAQPEEIREAFLERYGAELTPEQLDQVAAGMDSATQGAIAGGIMGGVTLAAMAAVGAAA